MALITYRLNLLEALLVGKTPESLTSWMARPEHGTYPMDLGMSGGYPSDNKVEEIRLIALKDARRWLHDEFPHLWKAADGYLETKETKDLCDEPALEIYAATGGWSGCESVIEAVLDHIGLAHYCRERLSGGGYRFVVPHEDPKPYVARKSAS